MSPGSKAPCSQVTDKESDYAHAQLAKSRIRMHDRGTCSGAEPMGPLGGVIIDAPDCSNIASEGTSFDLPVPQQRSEQSCQHHAQRSVLTGAVHTATRNLTSSAQHAHTLCFRSACTCGDCTPWLQPSDRLNSHECTCRNACTADVIHS